MDETIMRLLNLYREKREVDGLNGRIWDASRHWELDNAIQLAEETWGRHLSSRINPTLSNEKDPVCSICGGNHFDFECPER